MTTYAETRITRTGVGHRHTRTRCVTLSLSRKSTETYTREGITHEDDGTTVSAYPRFRGTTHRPSMAHA